MKTPFERGQNPEGTVEARVDGLLYHYPNHWWWGQKRLINVPHKQNFHTVVPLIRCYCLHTPWNFKIPFI
jgi:hypothetical protein